MTNEELFTDLKQYIAATISQEVAQLATKDDLVNVEQRLGGRIDSVEQRLDGIDKKLDDVQDAIAETLTHALEPIDTTLQDHERRLGRLERRSA